MSQQSERLYELLPDFIRFRDAIDSAQGEPLRALMGVLQSQYDLLHTDIEGLYRNWFIETCDEWVIPYIGDLLGVRGLGGMESGCHSRRALVANTIAYRRRKGTSAALAGVARDATGWPVHVREMSKSVVRSQNLSRIRPGEGGTFDLRDADGVDLLGTPFDRAAYSADISRPNLAVGETVADGWRRPRACLESLGIYFWRLRSYPVDGVTPFSCGHGRFKFDPLGRDLPLFNRPFGTDTLPQETAEADYPVALRVRPLAREIEARRLRERPSTSYFGSRPVFEIRDEARGEVVGPDQIAIMDLGDGWSFAGLKRSAETVVVVDPVRGRFVFVGDVPQQVSVSYCYGFGGDVGGGPYERRDSLKAFDRADMVVAVSRRAEALGLKGAELPGRPLVVSSLQAAFEAIRREGASHVIVRIEDSATYEIPKASRVELEARSELRIEAADGQRPCLLGSLAVKAGGDGGHGRFALNGLWIEGGVELSGRIRASIDHCSLNRPDGQPAVRVDGRRVELNLRRSIVSGLLMPSRRSRLRVEDSVIDGRGEAAVAGGAEGTGPSATILRSTLLGSSLFATLHEADSSIFNGPVVIGRPWEARIRHSSLPPGSVGERADYRRPVFSSTDPGHPGYAQLATSNSKTVLLGGRGGSEMGVFHHLCENQRASGLAEILGEYVPWGMEAWLECAT